MQLTDTLTTVVWNPVTGCDQISAGCDNCYALNLSRRLKAFGQEKYQADGDPRTSGPGFAISWHEQSLEQPQRWKKPRVVFVSSMGDLFHAKVPTEFLQRVFSVMASTPQHTYWLLTKRPARARTLAAMLDWPSNVWLGVSVEENKVLHRLEDLRATPAPVKMLFCEPLLGSLDDVDLDGIGWVTVAGEAGRKARPMSPDWARSLRDQAVTAGVPFYFKQWSGPNSRSLGRELDGREWNELPLALVGA
ncbi:MAG: phage Gp37/Gp68 family protein [Pseudonocardia sp.]|nr:phage Gp37/Gp68 family protein [Pseudonocardia sp.]